MNAKAAFQSAVCLVSVLWGIVPVASAQSAYNFQIVAKTGDITPAGNTIIALGAEPSINDAGKVAFLLQIQDGRVAVFAKNGNVVEKNFGLYLNNIAGSAVQINNVDQMAVRDEEPATGDTRVLRLQTGTDPLLGIGSYGSFWQTPLEYLLQWPSLNNNGRGVYGADLKTGGTVLATRDGINLAYQTSPPLSGYPNFYPMIADNDRIVVRGGNSQTAPIVVFNDASLAQWTGIAASDNFYALGARPGISDNGVFTALCGFHRTQGEGVFGVVNNVRFKIAGASEDGILDVGETWIDVNQNGVVDLAEDAGFFHSFSWDTRVGVNRSANTGVQSYTVVFLANARRNRWEAGPRGIFAAQLDVTNHPSTLVITPPTAVIKIGDTIPGLDNPNTSAHETVTDLSIYDPVNNRGEIVFWARTSDNKQAIVKATLANKPVIALVRGTHVLWEGYIGTEPTRSKDAHYYWDKVERLLQNDFEVWTCDTITGTQVVEDEAQLFHEYIQRKLTERNLRSQPALTGLSIVAHSYGGLISRQYLHTHPNNLVQKVVMLSTPNCGSHIAQEAFSLLGAFVNIPAHNSGALKINTEAYIQNTFNPVTNHKHPPVPFFLLGGEGSRMLPPFTAADWTLLEGWKRLINWPVNTVNPNDGAVTVLSAFGLRWPSSPSVAGIEPQVGAFWRWASPYNDHTAMANDLTPYGSLDLVRRILLGQWYPPSESPRGIGVIPPPSPGLAGSLSNLASIAEPGWETALARSGNFATGAPGPLVASLNGTALAQFSVLSSSAAVSVSLISPIGEVISPGTANSSVSYTETLLETGIIKSFVITSPTFGNWTVNVASTNASSSNADWQAAVAEVSKLRCVSSSPYFEDTASPFISVRVLDGQQPLTGAIVTAQVQRPDGGVDDLTLIDDGLHRDGLSSDGNYGAPYNAVAPGLYSVAYQISGVDNTNRAYSRVCSAPFQIASPTASLTGSYSDQGLDTAPAVGFEFLNVAVEVNVTVAGKYSLSSTLADASGNELASATVSNVDLPVGMATLILQFSGDLLRAAMTNGPYHLTKVALWNSSSGTPLRTSYSDSPYTTENYQFADFSVGPQADFAVKLAITQADDVVTLRWTGKTGVGYSVETSTDLIQWQEIATKFNELPNVEFSEAIPSGTTRRFYRVKEYR